MLDLRRLRLLSELARRGTIAEVARAVGYTPSAVSQALARLEREAGVGLLERDGRRVRLTPAARDLVRRTDRVLAELDAAEAELAASHGIVAGQVSIGAFPSAAAALVVPTVTRLTRRHPQLGFSVLEHEPEDGIALLRSGELELLVSESYQGVDAAPVGGLEQHLLLTEPLLLVLPADDPRPDPVRVSDLRDADWAAGQAGTQFARALEHACRAGGFRPRIAHRADDARLHLALAAAGMGVGLLPAMACPRDAGVRYARLDPEPPCREVWALARRGAARRPAIAATIEALKDVAAQPG